MCPPLKSIVTGGFGMRARHLARYTYLPQRAALSHNSLQLCSVAYGMPAYISRLRREVAQAEHEGERVVLHVLSASAWYVMDYLRTYQPKNVCGLVLESTPYRFNLEPLARELLPAPVARSSCALLDALLRLNGASDEWRSRYLETLENPPVDHVLVIGSQQDSMIPAEQFTDLSHAMRLTRDDSKVSSFISDCSRHALAVKDDPKYGDIMNRWIKQLEDPLKGMESDPVLSSGNPGISTPALG